MGMRWGWGPRRFLPRRHQARENFVRRLFSGGISGRNSGRISCESGEMLSTSGRCSRPRPGGRDHLSSHLDPLFSGGRAEKMTLWTELERAKVCPPGSTQTMR